MSIPDALLILAFWIVLGFIFASQVVGPMCRDEEEHLPDRERLP